ncbi:uncharacterized protein LOC141641187 [Silene latifolia]|uniref:uncharacterized protein LOC141641187 n=1 Tax=Silene latifolia TaxID=37657 RepID=UPI003D7807A3
MDLIHYLFEKPVLNGRMSRWTLMLSEFDLKYVPLKVIKGRAVAYFLADNPIEETEVIDTWSFPDENVVHVENEIWDLYFHGASNYMGYGVGILLISPTGEHVPMSIKLDFNVTNNAAEYEACLLGLRSALDLGLKKLLAHGDSSTREENQFGDALSKLAALINIPDHINSMSICVERRSSPAYVNVIDDTEEAYGTFHVIHHDVTLAIFNLGIDIIGKVHPSGTRGHCFILVAIDYFTKWVEAKSYKVLKAKQVAQLRPKLYFKNWIQARYDSLVMLDERRLNALYHVQLFQKRIVRAFNKKVKPRGISEGDLVLKSVRPLLPIDPRGKFKPNWAGPYLVKKILSGGVVRLTDLDGNDFTNPTNLDQLKKYYP